jgi:DNA polymerase-3 subunit alpha
MEVILGGLVTGLQVRNVQKSRSGLTRMAKFTFEDLHGTTPAMLWPEEYARMGDLIKDDAIGFIRGTINLSRDPAEIEVTRFIPIENAEAELAKGVIVTLRKGVQQQEDLERLLRIVRVRPGNLDLYLEIFGLENVRRVIYRAGASLKVRYDDRMVSEMGSVVGLGNVRVLGARGATARPEAASQPPARVAVGVGAGMDAMEDMEPDDD